MILKTKQIFNLRIKNSYKNKHQKTSTRALNTHYNFEIKNKKLYI
jgi:hypothetical protein